MSETYSRNSIGGFDLSADKWNTLSESNQQAKEQTPGIFDLSGLTWNETTPATEGAVEDPAEAATGTNSVEEYMPSFNTNYTESPSGNQEVESDFDLHLKNPAAPSQASETFQIPEPVAEAEPAAEAESEPEPVTEYIPPLKVEEAPAEETKQEPAPAAEAKPAPEPVAEEAPDTPEASAETINRPQERGEKSSNAERIKSGWEKFKQTKFAKTTLTGALILMAAGAIFTAGKTINNLNNKDKAAVESVDENAGDKYDEALEKLGVSVSDGNELEANYEGIRDGYDQPGMYIDANGGRGSHKFADAAKMFEAGCPGDAREFVKAVANNQVESMASYMFGMPDKLLPEEYQGLTSSEMEAKLESLSDEEFESIRSYFMELIDKAVAEDTTLNGNYHNFYIGEKDENGKYAHDNMELKQCQTNEKGTKATKLSWYDGDELIGSMTVKLGHTEGATEKDPDSWKGCVQVVFQEGNPKVIIIDSPTIPTPDDENPPTPTPKPTPTPTPTPTPAPKDAENMIRIDNEIKENIAEDINSNKVEVHQTEKTEPAAEAPSSGEFSGTSPVMVQNEASKTATESQPASPENDYSQNRGGANEGNAEANPVLPNEQAQAEANAAEITTPASAEEIARSLGIN